MITIYDKNEVAYVIRPCPLINITWNGNFDEDGPRGGKYDIVLTGTLLDNGGSPVFNYAGRQNPDTATTFISQYYPAGAYSKPPQQTNPEYSELNSILAKQVALRKLFSKDCARIEVASVEFSNTEPVIKFYPKFISLNFGEGLWINKCDYTITLEAQFLLSNNDKVIGSESYANRAFKPGDPGWPENTDLTIQDFLDKVGGFIEDFQETWAIETEDGNGNTFDPYTTENITRIYRLTRNITAKGKNISAYQCFGTQNLQQDPNYYKAHQQARRYVVNYISNTGITGNHWDDYPAGPSLEQYFGSGIINLSAAMYGGYNHSRSENIDVSQGTYSVQDTWILSSGNSYENYSLSLNSSESNPRNTVSINGTIKGLTSIPASGSVFGGNATSNTNTAYENAINKYRGITNNGNFGVLAHVFKRAQNAAGGITLNEVPLSVALGTNEFTGEITYTIDYDDRPKKLIDGVVAENINVSDTYPGDVFAIIPVIGRPTGPVLQYIGGRTEYQRALSIELIVNTTSYTGNQDAPDYAEKKNRQNLLQKPSLVSPLREGIIDAINAYTPAREPGIRKYFVSPPQETWDPKEGRYTLNITWTYELSY